MAEDTGPTPGGRAAPDAVPGLLGELAAVDAALDEAMPNRSHTRPAAFYVRHLAAVRDAALAAATAERPRDSDAVTDGDLAAVEAALAADPDLPARPPPRDVLAAVLAADRARREGR